MASLLERLNVAPSSAGPVRSKTSSRSSTPYARPPRGDPDSDWKHDMFEGNTLNSNNSLAARLGQAPAAPRAIMNPIVQKALRAASNSTDELSIKGASLPQGNVVEVTGLVSGTTAEDVSAIFKTCGVITGAQLKSETKSGVVIRITFKLAANAVDAVARFNGQPADGRILGVRIVGGRGTSLAGRIGGTDGLGIARQEGSVDVLMEGDDFGSKMRSDSLVKSDPRAQVLIAPPGADPAEYTQQNVSQGPRRGPKSRGRGGRRGGRGLGGGQNMEIDR